MIDYEAKARELRDAWCPDYDVYPTVEQIAAALREADEAGAARGAAAERERAAQLCRSLARQVGILRSLKATHKADAFKEAATVIRARGAK